MEQYKGKTILPNIAIGKIWIYSKVSQEIPKYPVEHPEEELVRYEAAKEQALLYIKECYEKSLEEVGEEEATIFLAHQMILMDEEYNQKVCDVVIQEKVNVEYAVLQAQEHFAAIFSSMDDDFFKEREADFRDVSKKLLSILLNREACTVTIQEPSIVVAKELTPGETIQMDKSKMLGFVTEIGSTNSHTAILARMMNLPAIMGVEVQEAWNGKMAALDGEQGILYIEPEQGVLDKLKIRQRELLLQSSSLENLKGKETCTKDGKKISLYANVGSVSDVKYALDNDAEGIGLFRSEFLYLGRETAPTEEEQFEQYKAAAVLAKERNVVIRTLDIGADKKVDYLGIPQEENPAMGLRAIRFCLENPEIFKTQLRAIYRASAYGNLSVMYPMITSCQEIVGIKRMVETVKAELTQEKIPYKEIEQGIMIETPAAAMISEQLAKEVDFFSVGTNDLSQYILAVDRQNPNLDAFYNPYHPAILKMIQMTVENGHKAGCKVGICGELAADERMAEKFLEMGVDELSVAPGRILPMRQHICNLHLS